MTLPDFRKNKKVLYFLSLIGGNCIPFLLGILLWMFVDVFLTKGIDSSFISAIMDSMMTGVAIAALFKAKQVWSERSKQDGYRIASRLITDYLIRCTMSHDLNRPLLNLTSHITGFINFYLDENKNKNKNKSEEVDSIDKLAALHNDISNQLYEHVFPLSQEVQFDIFRLRKLGVNFSDSKDGLILKRHFDTYQEFTIKLESLIYEIRFFLNLFYSGNFNSESSKNDIIIPGYRRDLHSKLESLYVQANYLRGRIMQLRDNLTNITKSPETVPNYFNL